MVHLRVLLAIYAMQEASLRVFLPAGRLPEATMDEGTSFTSLVRATLSDVLGTPGVADAAVDFDIGSLRPVYAEVLPPLDDTTDGVVVPALVLLPRSPAPVPVGNGRLPTADCSGAALLSCHPESLHDPAKASGPAAAVVRVTRERLVELMLHTRAAMVLAGPVFSMTQLRQVYESMWGTSFDPSNFQKRMLGGGLVKRVPADLSDPPVELDTLTVVISDQPPRAAAVQYTYGPDDLPALTTMTVWRDGVGRPAGLFVRGLSHEIDPTMDRPGA